MDLKVYKFGGSSVANAAQLKKVKEIIFSNNKEKIIVTSAAGKSFSGEEKITDLLIELYQILQAGEDYKNLWNQICRRYLEIDEGLNLNIIEEYLKEIEEKFSSQIDQSYLVSRGEYLSAKLLSRFLGFDFVDATEIFEFDDKLNLTATIKNIEKHLSHGNVVVPGFYGRYKNGIKLFARGGSDVSAAIIASALECDYYNFTDVSGVFDCDPSLKEGKVFKNLSYSQLELLSRHGACVIAPDTIKYIKDKNIKLYVKNTNQPAATGTLISNKKCEQKFAITKMQDKLHLINLRRGKVGTFSYSENALEVLYKIVRGE